MQKADGGLKPPNPFNPGSPIDPSEFVGRQRQLGDFAQKLRQTAQGSLASMSVIGGYGVGKTSFLHKCRSIAEEEGALTIYLSLNELDNLNRASLARELISRITEKVRGDVMLKRISDGVLDVLSRIRIKTESGVEVSIGQREQTPNLQAALQKAWGALDGHRNAIVFLIDEARALERNRAELVLYLRAVLEQLQVSRTPVMIVPAGNLAITGPSGTGFSPLVRTFPPAIMENFSQTESLTFAGKKLAQANAEITGEAARRAHEVSEGHPYVLTAYLAAAYDKLQAQEHTISAAHLNATDLDFTARVLAPFFSRFYDEASPASKAILKHMAAQGGEAALSELSAALGRNPNELSPYLGKLVQEGAVKRVERGKYSVFHHLLAEYVRHRARQENA
ncbi:MAG: BREX system ATP-binding domain-containing protein [Candidatus Micrarchaeota archaeon]